MKTRMKWTPELSEQVENLAAMGMTPAQIGPVIGIEDRKVSDCPAYKTVRRAVPLIFTPGEQ